MSDAANMTIGTSATLNETDVPSMSTPAHPVPFRNVRPLQAAFQSTGLVSKKRRGLSVEELRAPVDHDLSGSLNDSHWGPMPSSMSLGQDLAPPSHSARPLREVVEAAMADRSFQAPRQESFHVMPDTPMKPTMNMATTAATSARMHRRGRSMGNALPSRSPLFPATPKDPFAALKSGTAQTESRDVPHTMASGLAPHTQVRRPFGHTRNSRSASERISIPRSILTDGPSRPTAFDSDDVFEVHNESPLRTMAPAPPASHQFLPILRHEARVPSGTAPSTSRSSSPQPSLSASTSASLSTTMSSSGSDCLLPKKATAGFGAVCPIPTHSQREPELPRPVTPMEDSVAMDSSLNSCMDSPNNVFALSRTPVSLARSKEKMSALSSANATPLLTGAGTGASSIDSFDTSGGAVPGKVVTWMESTPTAARGGAYSFASAQDTQRDFSVAGLDDDGMAPHTPTRKTVKWYEATHSPVAQTTQKTKPRPRHSAPVQAPLQTPTPHKMLGGSIALAKSAPAGRARSSRASQFEEHFVVEGMLGSGEFSEVVKVREKATGYISAVKRMKRPFSGPKDRIRRLEEVDVLCLLKQRRASWPDPWFGAEGVVELLDAWEEDGFLYLQTELCPLGSLAFVLGEYGRLVGALDEARLWKVLAELSSGLDFIHRCGVLHLDLKPANILITEVGTLKISDFGMALRWPRCSAQEILAGAHLETGKFAPAHNAADMSMPVISAKSPGVWGSLDKEDISGRVRRQTTRAPRASGASLPLEREGDREYIAPEVFFESKYGPPADIFSLGLIMLEAACSVEIPDNGEPWHKLRHDDFSDVCFDGLSPLLLSVITSMLSSEPALRPSAMDLVNMPALSVVRQLMRRGLQANELDQLPSLGGGTTPAAPSPYPLPPSKYYEPPHAGVLQPERKVVKIRGAMIQEDEPAFLARVWQAGDAQEMSSPDTSASLMTDDLMQPSDAGTGLPDTVPHCSPAMLRAAPLMDENVEPSMEVDKMIPM